ncbi:TBC1 domain family member 12 isoform X1 [Syngnathus scovelli]|uniref:TBC1 domain family member 12 isoform X1 n=2 Tax=Syngnathus scovelli TaxID=161590 RepID=UPI0021107337|nr:TBC1 domain family member 12 isoform X1 [Syngnathus scovelli]
MAAPREPAGSVVVDVNDNEEDGDVVRRPVAALALKCSVTCRKGDDAVRMLDLAERCLRDRCGLNGSAQLWGEVEVATAGRGRGTGHPASCPAACGARVSSELTASVGPPCSGKVAETCPRSEPQPGIMLNGCADDGVSDWPTAVLNGGCHAATEARDNRSDPPVLADAPEPARRAAGPPSTEPSASSELSEDDTSPSEEEVDSVEPAWVVRPQTLRTEANLSTSLSCDATPLSPSTADQGDFCFGEQGGEFQGAFEAGRRQSAPESDLRVQDTCDETGLAPKRFGIVHFFTRSLFPMRAKESAPPSHDAPGWRLFGKPRDAGEGGTASSSSMEQVSLRRPPAAGRRKNLDFEPLSTTALILEDRPLNLPAKSEEETQRHKLEYEEMVAGAKRRELKDAQKKRRQMKERHRHEDSISNAMVVWNTHILPHWNAVKATRRVRDLWWQGLPPGVRGRVWSLAIGNELNITGELYDIFLCRAKEKWRSYSETSSVNNDSESDGGTSLADRESSLELIKLDISRTFPSLFIFQKGGPFHDVLHSVLGAYTCYRPDIGYVQGMSFIAAVLILNLEEADAFVTFANLLNKPCQMAFYRVDHDLMLKYFAVFEVFFEENLPRLFSHFRSNKLTPDLYLIDWIFTLYSKSLPLDVACRVWDVFCRDGEESLFRTGLGILRLFQDVLLQMDFIRMAQFLSRLPEDLQAHALFAAMAATHMISRNRRWAQVFSSLPKDKNKETDNIRSPALRS